MSMRWYLVLACVLVAALFCGCKGGEDKLVGRWTPVSMSFEGQTQAVSNPTLYTEISKKDGNYFVMDSTVKETMALTRKGDTLSYSDSGTLSEFTYNEKTDHMMLRLVLAGKSTTIEMKRAEQSSK